MKERKTAVRTWEKTRLSYLVRHKRTGGYYARAYAKGKEVWRSLKTKHFSVAESRLAEFLKGHRETPNAHAQASSAKLMFGAAAEIYRQRLNDNVKIKPRTREYYAEILASLKKSWPKSGRNRGAQGHPGEMLRLGRSSCEGKQCNTVQQHRGRIATRV